MPEKTDEQKDVQLVLYQKAFDYADKSITYVRSAIANGRIALCKRVFSTAGVANSV